MLAHFPRCVAIAAAGHGGHEIFTAIGACTSATGGSSGGLGRIGAGLTAVFRGTTGEREQAGQHTAPREVFRLMFHYSMTDFVTTPIGPCALSHETDSNIARR